MLAGDMARLYHRLTSYDPEREWTTPIEDPWLLQDFRPNDLDRLPPQVKSYPPGLPVTPLPRELPVIATAATTVLAGTGAGAPAELTLLALARLLHLSAGIVRTSDHATRGRLLFRAAGSAGGKFPLEVYVAARGVVGLPDGVHWFDPVRHTLVQVAPAPGGETTTVIVTGIPWRTGWRYSERCFRHIYWDAGSMLAQLQALAISAGLPALVRTTFSDAEVTRLIGADGTHEFPLVLLSFGEGMPALRPTGLAVDGTIADRPLEFPLVTATQRAGDGERLGEPWPASAPLDGPLPASLPLDEAILRRGSTRLMAPGAALPREMLEWSLAAAFRGMADLRPDPQFVVVHAVDGMEPGLYRWPELHRPLRSGNLRDQVYGVCMDQGLGGDASYVVLSAADLAVTEDRGYRVAQLAAGMVEGRLHLAAFAGGAGASGMTFYDSELPDLLGEPLAGLLVTCVGVPEYRHKPGGGPGHPVAVRIPSPRLGPDRPLNS